MTSFGMWRNHGRSAAARGSAAPNTAPQQRRILAAGRPATASQAQAALVTGSCSIDGLIRPRGINAPARLFPMGPIPRLREAPCPD